MLRWMCLAVVLGFSAGIGAAPGMMDAETDDPTVFFETRIRPVLANSCVKCHGPEKASGDLRLDSREAMVQGGLSGPAIEPGDPENSLLLIAIRHDDDFLKMPPDEAVAKSIVADFTAWVASGAAWPEAAEGGYATVEAEAHWAFAPLSSADAPVDPTGWATDPIDQHIAARRSAAGLGPVAPADRRALIRRATFDLTGLPPEPERVEAFVADERPDAYARLIDELLASPRYGERWGRYWLDLARYADTAGDNSDYPIPEAYLYRDYVIDAFNGDIPYDRFLHEQLAGDILARAGEPDDYARQVIATGFVAQAKRFGTRELEDMHQIIEDTLNTTGQVVLGLSLRCARCHDHKFDPISAREYYGLYGIFSSTQFPFAGAEEVTRQTQFAPLILPEDVAAREARHAETIAAIKARIEEVEAGELGQKARELDQAVAAAAEQIKAAESSVREELEANREQLSNELAQAREQLEAALKPIRDELAAKEKESPLADAPVAYAVREGTPADAELQKGGVPHDKGEVVPRGALRAVDGEGTLEIPEGTSGRLQLARWLTGDAGHLAARVMANRIWQHHFGKPIVATPSDFGLRGTPPTHPGLLDELARTFIAEGWSIKALHRKIMLSKTYQLASGDHSANAAIDSGNALYWRFDRRPLDAESLRDTLLHLGANLDLARPGPHPFPPKGEWRFTAHHQFKALYPSNHRSVYLMVQRLHPHPYLKLFNGPDTSMTTAVRDSSTVPLQALFLLNNTFVHEQAGLLAANLLSGGADRPERLRLAYLRAYARPPSDAEQARAGAFLDEYAASLATEGMDPAEVDRQSWAALARALLASNEFIFVD